MKTDAAKFYGQFMEEMGIDTSTPHSKDTAARVAKMFGELTEGLRKPTFKVTTFPRSSNHAYDQLIIERGIPFISLCAHHHVPFAGKAHVGYLPDDAIVGLSKIVRIVRWISRKPSIQEDLTEEIADYLMKLLKPRAVMVMIEAEHFCVSMRGVEKAGVMTITHCIRGELGLKMKDEFLTLVKI